jgi:hypothetical protein
MNRARLATLPVAIPAVMDPPAIPKDDEYEEHRRQAEKVFFLASVGWLERLVSEAKKLPRRADPVKRLVAVMAAGLSGTPLEPEPTRRVSPHVVLELAELCRQYGEAELQAYAEFLKRSNVPPSLAVSELEKYEQGMLEEIRRRKWAPAMKQISGPFETEPCVDETWHFVVEDIDEFVQGRLARAFWLNKDRNVPAPVPGAELERVETRTRRVIDQFILTVGAAGRRISRKDIWTVAGYKERTEFERFQREDSRLTDSARNNFTRTLNMLPEAFIAILKKIESTK